MSDNDHAPVKKDKDADPSDVSSRNSSPLMRRAENFLKFARKKKKLKKKPSNTLKIHSLLPSPDSNDDSGMDHHPESSTEDSESGN